MYPSHRQATPRITQFILCLLGLALSLAATGCAEEEIPLQGDTAQSATEGGPGETDENAEPSASQPEASSTKPSAPDLGEATESETTTAESAAVGVKARGGAAQSMLRVSFAVHDTVATSTDPASVIQGSPVDDGTTRWITTVEIESLRNLTWALTTENFGLQLPTGEEHTPTAIFDSLGEQLFNVPLSGRERHVVHLVFEPNDAAVDLTEADLVVFEGNGMPARIPLQGSAYAATYPIALADGATTAMSVGGFGGCTDAEFDTRIESASIDIEGQVQFDSFERMPEGERLLHVDLRVTGTSSSAGFDSSSANCGVVGLWPEFRVLVDGRPTEAFSDHSPTIEGLASTVLPLRFQIPATATQVDVVGGADSTLASWDLDLPAAVGEPGAKLSHFSKNPEFDELTPAWGDRPDGSSTATLAAGGAVDTMTFVQFEIGESIATNVAPGDLPCCIDEEDRNWLVVDLGVESLAELNWLLSPETFVLIDPAGNPRAAEAIYDRTGESVYNVQFDGIEFFDLSLAFETDGLITDASGWRIQVESGDVRPLVLPLSGDAPGSGYPLGLRVGDNAQLTTNEFPGCSDPLIDVTVNQITIDIEGIGHWGNWTRTDSEHLLVPIELAIANLADNSDFRSNTQNCGVLALWPGFLLFADGVPLNSFNLQSPSIEFGAPESLDINFEIPVDTQTITLTDGAGEQIIGTWELKDAGEVLENFGATQVDTRTLITLDETVLFAFGESELRQSAFSPLNRVASVLNSEASDDVFITGHTDAIGDDASNQALSEARAQAVADALIEAGVDADRLIVAGAGETTPVAPNTNDDGSDNPEGREQNRRVEILFTTR